MYSAGASDAAGSASFAHSHHALTLPRTPSHSLALTPPVCVGVSRSSPSPVTSVTSIAPVASVTGAHLRPALLDALPRLEARPQDGHVLPAHAARDRGHQVHSREGGRISEQRGRRGGGWGECADDGGRMLDPQPGRMRDVQWLREPEACVAACRRGRRVVGFASLGTRADQAFSFRPRHTPGPCECGSRSPVLPSACEARASRLGLDARVETLAREPSDSPRAHRLIRRRHAARGWNSYKCTRKYSLRTANSDLKTENEN